MERPKKNNSPEDTRSDLPDSPHDIERMKSEETTLDLPEVKDIPGQEHIHVPPLGELADTTISSDDEEGKGILDEPEEDEIATRSDSNVSRNEKELLADAADSMSTPDDQALKNARVDRVDDDGELLNERTRLTGSDLDVPGSEQDDKDEKIGKEDEENNLYSLNDERD